MFGRWEKSWQLVKASWEILRADRELLIFPIISMIALIVVSIAFLVPSIAAGLFDSMGRNGRSDGVGAAGLIVAFLFYVVNYTVIFFANSALVGAAMIRLSGGDPTVQDGIRIASERMVPIVGYAVISATVGMVLNAVSRRSGAIGQIVIGIIGFAWNIATFLVVPVLVVENLTPIDAVKRSAQLLKQTWGEQLIGNFGVGTVFGLISFALFILCFVMVWIGTAVNSPSLLLFAVGVGVIGFIVIGLISSTLQGIFTAALYKYATEGSVGDMFEASLMRDAFRHK